MLINILKSYIFCLHFNLYLHVWILIRIRILNTDPDPDPGSSWLRIRIHNTALLSMNCLNFHQLMFSCLRQMYIVQYSYDRIKIYKIIIKIFCLLSCRSGLLTKLCSPNTIDFCKHRKIMKVIINNHIFLMITKCINFSDFSIFIINKENY